MTDVRMGKKLFPAVQVRNNLKAMVQSGALSATRRTLGRSGSGRSRR